MPFRINFYIMLSVQGGLDSIGIDFGGGDLNTVAARIKVSQWDSRREQGPFSLTVGALPHQYYELEDGLHVLPLAWLAWLWRRKCWKCTK